MSKPMIEINNVSKEYRLGAIGGKTLNAEIQTKLAKLMGREDPNSKIGARQHEHNEKFMALDGVSFSVQPGEAVGIIGHNGAGKSTLLKLISRVTAPSGGDITLRGRVASMLEVGTGFHPELTGRENVYLNGAILGMTKAEIDKKFDDIVEFAEMKQFIDTPVKRYSSGMYVKLAFSVAAHLDSEIMIMDEVLAVGDAKFQNKCLGKMSDEANNSGRTILYVSHNMSTIQRLCTRVVVLDHGKVVYDGDTQEGISRYLAVNRDNTTFADIQKIERNQLCKLKVQLLEVMLHEKQNNLYLQNDKLVLRVKWKANKDAFDVVLRIYIKHMTSTPVGFTTVAFGNCKAGEIYDSVIEINLERIMPGNFFFELELHEIDSAGNAVWNDASGSILPFIILENQTLYFNVKDNTNKIPWNHWTWGSTRFESKLIDNMISEKNC